MGNGLLCDQCRHAADMYVFYRGVGNVCGACIQQEPEWHPPRVDETWLVKTPRSDRVWKCLVDVVTFRVVQLRFSQSDVEWFKREDVEFLHCLEEQGP